jgi:hypothetical protein
MGDDTEDGPTDAVDGPQPGMGLQCRIGQRRGPTVGKVQGRLADLPARLQVLRVAGDRVDTRSTIRRSSATDRSTSPSSYAMAANTAVTVVVSLLSSPSNA